MGGYDVIYIQVVCVDRIFEKESVCKQSTKVIYLYVGVPLSFRL